MKKLNSAVVVFVLTVCGLFFASASQSVAGPSQSNSRGANGVLRMKHSVTLGINIPIDVWIERLLRERYFDGKRKPNAAKLREFSAQYFGEHGGYAQQYLFHHARTGSR